ncbi:helix-turn-helix domain-containing protein [Clostridium senegalense]
MFDKRLRKLRIDNELSQKSLADILGISPSTVAMYEQGRRTPDNEMLKKIANYFNVSVDFLLGNSNSNTPPTDDWSPKLNEKDEKDIEKQLDKILNGLENEEGLMLNGEILDETTRELLAQSIKNGLEYAKLTSKKKFTPKKYRKNNND